jgi:hypothetical protein
MSHLKALTVSMLCFAFLAAGAAAAVDRPYTQGSVWTVTFVRVKAGMGTQYLGDLANTWKLAMDEARKQQLIVSYKILAGNPSSLDDWTMMLLVEQKNWAAFDGADDKFDAILEKLIGPDKKQVELMVKRSDVREIVGTRNLQEIIFK